MAKKVRFPLEMKNGVQVRTIEELRTNFDMEKIMEYMLDGKLVTWLNDRYYVAQADELSKIDVHDSDIKQSLCRILDISLEIEDEIDVEEIENRKLRLEKLKKYSDNEEIWENVNRVAFDQEELAGLLDEKCSEIYLCGTKFTIPLIVHNIKYIGVNNPEIEFSGEGDMKYCRDNGIVFKNVSYDRNEMETAEQLYLEYKLVEAEKLLIAEAENGNGRAMWLLYMIYTDGGCGLDTDCEKAKEWCLKGKQAGDSLAALYSGLFYIENEDEKKEVCQEAKLKVKELVESGDILAQHALAISYANESDEPCDYGKVVEYLRESSDGGYWRSDNSLGVRYQSGQGVEKSDEKAFEYYKKSADAGYVHALHHLGEMYENVYRDHDKAEKCYQRAMEQYSPNMKKQWHEEILKKIEGFSEVYCRDLSFHASEETNADSRLGMWDREFSSQGACVSAAQSKIEQYANWLSQTWHLGTNRLNDTIDSYVNSIHNLANYVNERAVKIGIETIVLPEDLRSVVESYASSVLQEENYPYYSTYEAVNSVQCVDIAVDDSYLFRKARWILTGWNDKSIRNQEKEKITKFPKRLREIIYQNIWRSYAENI